MGEQGRLYALSVRAADLRAGIKINTKPAEQVARAKAEIRRLSLPLDARRTRRLRPDPHGPHIDLAATLRRSLRRGGATAMLRAGAMN